MIAASRGYLDIVQYLLDHGANIEGRHRRSGSRALHQAIAENHLEVVRYLIKRGANVESNDYQRRKPLHYATAHQLPEITMELIASKADLESRDEDGCTPLHYAVKGMDLGKLSKKSVKVQSIIHDNYFFGSFLLIFIKFLHLD